MIVIATQGGEGECSGESCARLQLNRIATGSAVQRGLQISSGVDGNRAAGRRSVRHRGLDINKRQLRRAIISAG